ncbi:MAG: CxxxxCH/CxxCH domain c-type cytochrome, partial [Myxococcaceae bacterium]
RSCHSCGGVLQFASPGPAIGSGPSPTFDATSKTCSSVACHGIPSGTFTYPFQGGDGEVVWNTVSYGSSTSETPSWYASFGSCGGCHGNPPGGGYVWHSGRHAGQGPTGTANQCQFCHPDAVSTNAIATGLSTATNCGPNGTYGSCAALHNNGTLEVRAKFTPRCMYCH